MNWTNFEMKLNQTVLAYNAQDPGFGPWCYEKANKKNF